MSNGIGPKASLIGSATPLHYVIRGGDPACVSVMLKFGASITGTGNLGGGAPVSAYDYALELGSDEIIKTIRAVAGKKEWAQLRELWLAANDKESSFSAIPEEIISLIHEQILVVPNESPLQVRDGEDTSESQ